MTAGRLLSMERSDAARFSMLLSIPTIAGIAVFAGLDLYQKGNLILQKRIRDCGKLVIYLRVNSHHAYAPMACPCELHAICNLSAILRRVSTLLGVSLIKHC